MVIDQIRSLEVLGLIFDIIEHIDDSTWTHRLLFRRQDRPQALDALAFQNRLNSRGTLVLIFESFQVLTCLILIGFDVKIDLRQFPHRPEQYCKQLLKVKVIYQFTI